MSGASSAFLDGHAGDRKRQIMRRQDLDLSELLTLCAKPLGIDERVAELRRYGQVYPELKYFLIVAYYCKDVFSQLNQAGPIDYAPSNVQRGASVETLQSMWTEVTRLYDTFPSGPRIKRGRAQQLLTALYKDDAELIVKLLSGTFYMKELNDAVVAKAFPEDTPKDPKS